MGSGKFRVLVRYEKCFGYEVEMFGTLGMLQSLNVLVHPVLPGQLVAPRISLFRNNRTVHI
jgi:hypothetical protein